MKYLDCFLDHLKLNHKSKRTIYQYNYILKIAKSYFKIKNLEDDKLITENHIIEYVKYLKENKTPDWIYLRLILYLKMYFNFLENSKIIFINPTESIETPKEIKRRIKPLPKEQVFECLQKIKTDTDYGVRSKAIIELLYSTGIRPFELLNIKINHIDFKKKEIFIEKGKMNKDRVVPVGDTALKWIQEYLVKVRPKYLKDKTINYLFITQRGVCKRLSDRGLHDVIKYTFKKYGIKSFKPYALRASCSTHCLLNGMDIMYIKKLLGHEEVTTTQGYLQINTLDLQNILNTKHPRNKY